MNTSDAGGDEPQQNWEQRHAHRIGQEVQRLRKLAKLTAQQLGDLTELLGLKMTRQAISDLENGRRRYVTTAELIVLAAALRTSPVNLVYPGPYQDEVEVLPRRKVPEFHAAQWFSGNEWSLNLAFTYADKRPDEDGLTGADKWRQATYKLKAHRQLADLHSSRMSVMMRGDFDRDRDTIAMYDKMIRDLEQQLGITGAGADDA